MATVGDNVSADVPIGDKMRGDDHCSRPSCLPSVAAADKQAAATEAAIPISRTRAAMLRRRAQHLFTSGRGERHHDGNGRPTMDAAFGSPPTCTATGPDNVLRVIIKDIRN